MEALMNITFIEFFIFGLASFRLTRLIVYDKVTEFIRRPFFKEIEEKEDGQIEIYLVPEETPVKKFFGELLSCYWCTGIWTSAFLVGIYLLSPKIAETILIFLAVAGFASIVEAILQQYLD